MERISYIHNDTNSIVNQLFFNIVKKKKKWTEKRYFAYGKIIVGLSKKWKLSD